MSSYFQMGYQNWLTLQDPDIGDFAGAVISPSSDTFDNVRDGIRGLRDLRDRLDLVLDPQLYNPREGRGRLSTWKYFPKDMDTADQSNKDWWAKLITALVDEAKRLKLNAVCSPALMPRRGGDRAYYKFFAEIADQTRAVAESAQLDALHTVLVPLRELTTAGAAAEIASIVTSSECERVYLVFISDVEARSPLSDATSLAQAIRLIQSLSSQMRVMVGYSSHELVLWKFAQAQDVATGGLMGLRRFNMTNWEKKKGGGGSPPVQYWNDGRLLTLLRDVDVLRLDQLGWFGMCTFDDNPAGEKLLRHIRSKTEGSWITESRAQFLRWANNCEASLSGPKSARQLVERSSKHWLDLAEQKMRYEDPYNTGAHVRAWLGAMNDVV